MLKRRNKWYGTARGGLLLCFLSGAVFSLPYFFESLFPLTYIALLCFFLLWKSEPLCRKEFRASLCFFLGFLLPLYSWFSALYPLSSFGYSKPAAFGLVTLFCLGIPTVQAVLQAAVLQLARFLPHESTGVHPLIRVIGGSALWILAEKLLSIGQLALPWGTIALSQTGCLPLLQTVSLFGTSWLTFFSVTVCGLIAEAFHTGRKGFLAAGSALFAGVLLTGSVLLLLPSEPQETVLAAAIQGNISTDEKWESDLLREVYDTYRNLTEQAAKRGAKLILLPESAVPVDFQEDGVLHTAFSEIASAYDCTIVMGILQYREDGLHNSLVAISPDGSLSTFYDKQHPVPFGEFLPFEKLLSTWFPSFTGLNLNESLTVGETEAYIQNENYRIGCFICYDSVFERTAEIDVDFSVIATNDAWFRDSAGVQQHLRYAKLRATESGKDVLRAANTGISALLDSKGRIIIQTEPLQQDILYGELSIRSGRTLYSITGNWFPFVSLLFLVLVFSCRIYKKSRHVKQSCQK